jgi:CubicO group peptidase (beta-lactamase class C family)
MQAAGWPPGGIWPRRGAMWMWVDHAPTPRSVLVAAALIAPAAAFAACGDSPPVTPTAQGTLASRLQGVVSAGSPGVISLVNDGHAIKLQAAGVADKASGRAMRPTARFRMGSNTKSFVATVALQLVAERKLSLDDAVERWLPGILSPPGRSRIRATRHDVLRSAELRRRGARRGRCRPRACAAAAATAGRRARALWRAAIRQRCGVA